MGAGIADGELAGQVSEAGGLGVIGASWLPAEEVRSLIRRARDLTDKPLGVNLLLFGNEELVDAVLRERPAVFSTAWAREDQDLGTIFARAHDAGAMVMHMVPTLDDAKRAASAGADVIVAQGTEGGGHVGLMGTAVIVRQVAKAVAPIPVVAAGGFADGAGLAAALALGASAILWEHGSSPPTRLRSTNSGETPCSRVTATTPSSRRSRIRTPAATGPVPAPASSEHALSKNGSAASQSYDGCVRTCESA